MKREDRVRALILLMLIIFGLFLIANLVSKYKIESQRWCDIYEDQTVTATRIPFENGEKQYGLNGTWIDERILYNNCKNFINT